MKPNYRRCVSCRRVAHRQELWRVIRLHPNHDIVLDHGMGRSAYLCPTADCLRAVQKKGKLARVLKAPVPDSIWQILEERLAMYSPTSATGISSSSGLDLRQ